MFNFLLNNKYAILLRIEKYINKQLYQYLLFCTKDTYILQK